MLDFNHTNADQRSLSGKISDLIDTAMASAERQSRRYLGVSALGNDDDPWSACLRSTQLDYVLANDLEGAPRPSSGFNGRTLRIFELGHTLEAMAIGWLRVAGFDLLTEKQDGQQFGFTAVGGKFRGHIDGILMDGPDVIAYPALWEHKGLNNKKWQEVVKKGVAVACPGYAAQMATYQAYIPGVDLTKNPALFHATNKDTQELYFESVAFNPQLAQRTSDRAVAILRATDAGELLPKQFNQEDHFVCKSCKWREFCW
jgi:hypothetical protein